MDDTVFLFENFISSSECLPYIEKIRNHWNVYKNHGDRTIDITNDPIVSKVQSFLQEKLSCKLSCERAKIQVWPENCDTGLHKHIDNTDFNSLIYLNDDFQGGEFYTEQGVVYKPITGSLTFFNGSEIMHGVKKVIENDRFTLIFWWKKRSIFHEQLFILDDFLDSETCSKYIEKYKESTNRVNLISIDEPELVKKVEATLLQKFGMKSEIEKCIFANLAKSFDWHIHDWFPKGCGCNRLIYNCVIYLNDGFEGGEFSTRAGVTVKPFTGKLLVFNTAIWHRVLPFSGNNRYSIRLTGKSPAKFI